MPSMPRCLHFFKEQTFQLAFSAHRKISRPSGCEAFKHHTSAKEKERCPKLEGLEGFQVGSCGERRESEASKLLEGLFCDKGMVVATNRQFLMSSTAKKFVLARVQGHRNDAGSDCEGNSFQ